MDCSKYQKLHSVSYKTHRNLTKKNPCDVHAMTCFFWQHFKKRVAGRVLCVVLAVSKL